MIEPTVEQVIGPSKDPHIGAALLSCLGKTRAVGIELELEHVQGYELPSNESGFYALAGAPGWAIKRDNSLRNNGAEFISFPSEINGIMEKVLLLFAQPKSKKWETSARTGLHVHVNVRDFTWQELRALVVTYCLVEPALFAWVGKEREENIFCVPYYRTPRAVLNFYPLQNKVLLQEGLQNLNANWCKYTALHLAPAARLGSVEFRHAPSWLDPPRIAAWARLCERVVSYAKGKEPKQVIEEWDSNWVGFISRFSWIPNYYEIVQKLDSDFLANVVAGIEVSKDAWNTTNSSPMLEGVWTQQKIKKQYSNPKAVHWQDEFTQMQPPQPIDMEAAPELPKLTTSPGSSNKVYDKAYIEEYKKSMNYMSELQKLQLKQAIITAPIKPLIKKGS